MSRLFNIELIGWIGGILMAVCGAPEAYNAVVSGNSALSWLFLGLWGGGEIFALAYTVLKSRKVKLLPLIFNYGLNIIFISIIIICKGF